MENRHLTVMLTELKNFTLKTSESSREKVHELMELHESLLVPVIERSGGKIIKSTGNSFTVTFENPANAVLCGLVIQDTLAKYNEKVDDEERLEIRVSISYGEVAIKDGDVSGEAVNIAAGIVSAMDINEVYFTEAVCLAINREEIPFSEAGKIQLKGIPQEIKVYRILKDRGSDLYSATLKKNFETQIYSMFKESLLQHFLDFLNSIDYSLARKSLAAVAIIFITASSILHFTVRPDKICPDLFPSVQAEQLLLQSPVQMENTELKLKELPFHAPAEKVKKEPCRSISLSKTIAKIPEPCQSVTHPVIESMTSGNTRCYKSAETAAPATESKYEKRPATISGDPASIKKPPSAPVDKVKQENSIQKKKTAKRKNEAKRNLMDPEIEATINNLRLNMPGEEKILLIKALSKMFHECEVFFQDKDPLTMKLPENQTKAPSGKIMKALVLQSLERNREKVTSFESAIDTIKFTEYPKTKWSRFWRKATGREAGGRRYYKVLDPSTGQIVTVEEYLKTARNTII